MVFFSFKSGFIISLQFFSYCAYLFFAFLFVDDELWVALVPNYLFEVRNFSMDDGFALV